MPTECERSSSPPNAGVPIDTVQKTQQTDPKTVSNMDTERSEEMATSTNGHSDTCSTSGRKLSITSADPTAYVAKARITRPAPPPPSYNPMQFVQIKPCNLYQTAQQQLKKAEEVKKIKEIKKEEPEDWQNNLDNWKSSRRKRVEHIIDRVVEVKKLELEEFDRSRRKSKTFSEMIEERGERGVRVGRAKLASLAVYNEDESNDLSDLGIGTSSASGKSSLSEDYDNNSVMSDCADLEKAIFDNNPQNCSTREYVSSPGYDTSSSTAPASSPDPCEYTYEGAIQDYKQRVSRATCGGTGFQLNSNKPEYKLTTNEPAPERGTDEPTIFEGYPARRGSKIEERLIGFEVNSPNDSQDLSEKSKIDLPKINISKRKEIFENAASKSNNNHQQVTTGSTEPKSHSCNGVPRVTLREHFKLDGAFPTTVQTEGRRLSGDITSIKDRLLSLEQQQNVVNPTKDVAKAPIAKVTVDIPVLPLKDRLSSLHNAATKEEIKKPPVLLIDARQLEIMKAEEEHAKQRMKQTEVTKTLDTRSQHLSSEEITTESPGDKLVVKNKEAETDRDDSGIHTSDDIDEQEERNMKPHLLQETPEQQLNEAIAALAIEEQQLQQAANAVNQIEAEFAELSDTTNMAAAMKSASSAGGDEQPCEMDFSVSHKLIVNLNVELQKIDRIANNACKGEGYDKSRQTNSRRALKRSGSLRLKSTTKTIRSSVTLKQKSNGVTSSAYNINEALELALQAIDRETATNFTTNTTPKNDHIVENSMETQFMNRRDVECAEILCDDLEQQEMKEKNRQIQNEPIYENVSTTSTPQVDAEVKIVPNYNKISHPNSDNGNPNNNNINVSKFVDVTSALSKQMNGLSIPQPHEDHSPQPLATADEEPYYQVPKSSEPYYDAPKHLRPIPVYENIEIFYSGLESGSLESSNGAIGLKMEPPKEKPPPPPIDSSPEFDDVDSIENGDNWSSDNTYETITNRLSNGLAAAIVGDPHPSPPIKRLNSTKRIKKELRHKRSSFLGIEGSADDDLESYLDLTVAPPPDMAQLLQEERRLEKQLYMKAGLCDSSDTGESRDSGVSENHSRQSSEPFTNSSEEADRTDELPLSLITDTTIKPNEVIYQNEAQLLAAQTPLLQTVKGNSAESWTESATVAAAATKSLTEATATANAKMLSIEEKIREQEEVLRVERELLHLEQEELKRQRENLMLRENIARRELQHGAKMLMSANRRSLQDLHAAGASNGAGFQTASTPASAQVTHQHQQQQPLRSQQIYANVPNLQQQYYLVDADYRKSMSDLNEFSKRLVLPAPQTTPMPPTKPMRAMQMANANGPTDYTRQHPSPPTQNCVSSLSKNTSSVTTPSSGQRQTPLALYPHHQLHLPQPPAPSNMTRNTLHALSATPKPKYTDGWVQVQNRKSFDSNFSNDPSWLTSYQQKRKSVPEAYMFSSNSSSNSNPRLMQEQEQRRFTEQNRVLLSTTSTPMHQPTGGSASKVISNPLATSSTNNKPLPDSIIQTLTERLQSKGIGERRRFETYIEKSPLHATSSYQQQGYQPKQQQQQQQQNVMLPSQSAAQRQTLEPGSISKQMTAPPGASTSTTAHDKVLSVSGKKKCSHCGDELGRGAAMIIESLLLFYHINCFKCCVCHVQLGDGLNGTDVRVRNHKLHCQNCYSSDDGIKFSCV